MNGKKPIDTSWLSISRSRYTIKSIHENNRWAVHIFTIQKC